MFRHLKDNPIYGHHMIMMLLVVHLIIGHRRLRDVDSYRDDEMVKRVLGLKRLPDVSTVSRSLANADEPSVAKVRSASRRLVTERLAHREVFEGDARLRRVGAEHRASCRRHRSRPSTRKRRARAATTPSFAPSPRPTRSLDVHHRPGNVHDSNGADAFIDHCVSHVRSCLPRAKVETRIDSAFFNETITQRLHSLGVAFTISVPFERFADLKGLVEGRKRWRRMAVGLDYFETRWKPKSWNARHRFIFIRKQVRCQNKLRFNSTCFNPPCTGTSSRSSSPTNE